MLRTPKLLLFCALGISACATSPFEQLVDELTSSGIDADVNPRGVTIYLPEVLFEFDRADLSPAGRATLDEVAAIINRSAPVNPVAVEGHADSTGVEVYNLDLSIRRANQVARVLRGAGIDGQRITSIGLGETRPAASNDERDGRRRNRRVEIVVMRALAASEPAPAD